MSKQRRFLSGAFGPPVLQVSSEESSFLNAHAKQRAEVTLIASVRRASVTAFNVTTRIDGQNPALLPLIVMTPRSGWYSCASERGGGIACWLELMRRLRGSRLVRDVLFVASSGHELGHLGIDAFVGRRPGYRSENRGLDPSRCQHRCRNTTRNHRTASDESPERRHATPVMGQGTTIQASDEEFEVILSRAMMAVNLGIARRNPRGTVPGGEAEVVHRGGGRYVSVIGSNALFHHPADHGSDVVDLTEIARFTNALGAVAETLLAER